MNERLHHSENAEHLNLDQEARKNLERAAEQAKGSAEISGAELEKIRHDIETRASSSKEIHVGEDEAQPSKADFSTHKLLKVTTYKRTLRHIQSRLKGSDKSFSRVLHWPTMERLSDIGAQSVARPTSLMIASVVTLLGSSYSLYIAKRVGFKYNLSLFVVLFVAGYGAGLLLELIGWLFRRHR
jgi:hypothetical protein